MRLLILLVACQMWTTYAFAQEQTLRSSTHSNSEFVGKAYGGKDYARKESAAKRILSQVNEQVVNEMRQAWYTSGGGTYDKEVVILLFRKDGALLARTLAPTNEDQKFTLNWSPAARAILHTHPNSDDPKPSPKDKQVADKLGVPIFTMTKLGMFV